jgi:DNA helicase-2/ATP-dependent DNA helicase PcrA
MRIDYQNDLNPAQYEAATTLDGPVLVIAGAGSGKTRTIVYRLARLVESGISPGEILLLTFTRKASAEMLHRAEALLGHQGLGLVRGGTFHGFAYSLLKQHAGLLGFERGATVMDRSDGEEILSQAKDRLKIGKGDRKFPKRATVLGLYSKSRNKELTLDQVLRQEAYHLGTYEDDLRRLLEEYERIKHECGLLDYDDLLFLLERLLTEHPQVREAVTSSISHIMVDEYQDTNLVQARLVSLLTKPGDANPNVMAVGDDAQSIYAFRGANVKNILHFPKTFPGTKLIKLEQNYRSTQPILELTNAILDGFRDKFAKRLFSERTDSRLPEHVLPFSDRSQARLVAAKVVELSRTFPLDQIAVLFRAGYQSYHVEVELNKIGLGFRKYGGIKFSEAAHIKDVLACLRLAQNTSDLPAWQRILGNVPGIGPKSAQKIHHAAMINDQAFIKAQRAKRPALDDLLRVLDTLRTQVMRPSTAITFVLEYYLPVLREKFPDDYPRREAGLEELVQISLSYDDIPGFLGDLSLDSPDAQEERGQAVTLSTVHSAKGLEWDAVLVIDLVEERFPSRHAMNDNDDFEEERRLLYVACTRARDSLTLFSPETLYSRELSATTPARVCPFLQDIPGHLLSRYREQFTGGVGLQTLPTPRRNHESASTQVARPGPGEDFAAEAPRSASTAQTPVQGTYCRHKIFGRGKVVQRVEPNKYKINFPGFGLKLIIEDFVELE